MGKRLSGFVFAAVFFTGATGVVAQTGSPHRLQAVFVSQAPSLDGTPDEPVWDKASKISNFTQRELEEGAEATEKTRVAVIYTTKSLYFGIWCYDRDASGIVATELKRDFNDSRDDNFKIILDTYDDDRNGYLFITNPNAARKDAQVLGNGENYNENWDGVWDVETTVNSRGWFAEVQVPFSTLKYPTEVENQLWGVNFERNIRRKREEVLWQGWSRDANLQEVNRAGTLTGLKKIRDKDFVELKPYLTGGGELNRNGNKGVLNGGGDVNYLVTPTLRANLTINTDFAQVEADKEQINLTRFPLFFPEKREFFLEGKDYFNMGYGGNRVTPFYSRRIGLTRDRKQVPVIAGGRILGKNNNATLGAMSIQTGKKDSLPSTNYTVFSWQQDVLSQSTVGAMTVNKYARGRWHTTTGVNARYSTSSLFGNKNMDFGGALVQTYDSDKSFNAQANAYRLFFGYPNDLITFYSSYQRSPAPFDPEVGLMRRRNFREAFALLSVNPRPKHFMTWIRQFHFQPGMITYTYFHDTKELQTFSYVMSPFGFTTRSGENFSFFVERNGEGVKEAFKLQKDHVIPAGEYWQTRYTLDFSTFQGRTFLGSASANWGGFFSGRKTQGLLNLQWRTSKYLTVSFDYEKNWVDLPSGSFQTDLWGSRFSYAFTPDLFGSLFTQWNDRDKLVILNYRLEWIPRIGTNFYFIVNQHYDTSGKGLSVLRTTLLAKLLWRFVV